MKQILFFLILVSPTFDASAQNSYKFLKLDFDEARVYLYNGSIATSFVVQNGKLDSTIVNPKGYLLSKQQLKKLDKLLGPRPDPKYIPEPRASCFDPHHGVVFYKKKNIVGSLDICFICNDLRSDFEITSEFSVYRLMPLFDSFQLKVEGQFYQCRDEKLAEAILRVNERRYGKDYLKKRYK